MRASVAAQWRLWAEDAHAGREMGVVDLGFVVRDGWSVVRKAICYARRVDLLAVVHAEEVEVGSRIRRKCGITEEGWGEWPGMGSELLGHERGEGCRVLSGLKRIR